MSRDRGLWAEDIACRFLESHGLELLARNFTRRIGELDLVFRDPSEQCFVIVEVRYRKSMSHGGALASIDRKKQQRLRKTAHAWLARCATADADARIDVLALEGTWESGRPANLPGEPEAVEFEGLALIWIKNALAGF